MGIRDVLEAVVKRVPPPRGDELAPPRALIFDCLFDIFRGSIAYVRVVDGSFSAGDPILFMGTDEEFEIEEVGIFAPKMQKIDKLDTGETGYIIATIREVGVVHIGDTITHAKNQAKAPLAGYKPPLSMVFCGLYPVNPDQFEELRKSLEKLRLNDSAFHFEPESSIALGFGFRCGFLGMLHMEVIQERLEREFGLSLITTAPNVSYEVIKTNGDKVIVDNPADLPAPNVIDTILEPMIKSTIITHPDYIGGIMKLAIDRRGVDLGMEYIGTDRVILRYEFPLCEVIMDFYDKLKSISSGYASFDYEFLEYRPGKLVKLDMLLNGEQVDALSVIVHFDKSQQKGRLLAEKLRQVVPRQQFDVAIQGRDRLQDHRP